MKKLKASYKKALKAKSAYQGAMGVLHSELTPFVKFDFYLNDFPDDGIMVMSEGVSALHVPVGMPIDRVFAAIAKDGELNEENFEPIG